MSAVIKGIQWFNRTVPWNKYKGKLAKYAASRLEVPNEPEVYDGIHKGLRLRLDLRSEAERWMFLNNYELSAVRLLQRILKPGDVYLDAGANVGLLALVASRCVGPEGKVYAFEPMPTTADRLRENVRLNHAENVTVFATGCWESPGTATLHAFSNLEVSGVSLRKRPGLEVGQEFAIPTVRLDDVIEPPVTLFKLDVEGAELPVLRGAEKLLTACRPHMIIELYQTTTASFGYEAIDILDWLLGRLPDYRLHIIRRRRPLRVTRDEIARRIQDRPHKHHDVYLQPR